MKNHLSEEILDILNESPRWVVRMGATVILFLLLLFLAGTWFIRYPEVLKGAVVVTTTAPTLKVVSESGGRLVRLLVPSGNNVRKGDILAEMENPTRLDNTRLLEQLLHQTQDFLKNPKSGRIQLPSEGLTWGDMQTDVQTLCTQYQNYQLLQTDAFYPQQVANLHSQISALQQLQLVHKRKKALNQSAFENSSDTYKTDRQLFDEGIYSKTEFLRKENDFLGKRREQEDFSENAIKNDLKLAEIQQELQGVEYAYAEKQRSCLEAIGQAAHNIENGLRHWQQQYLLLAPADGKLVYLQNLAENQFVKPGETLFAVTPGQQEYVARVEIPVKGLGKVRPGQKVVLKMDDYPFQEFGTVEGAVQDLAPSVDVKTYHITVALPHGLQSSYNRQFLCQSEMSGTAEVVTDDMRLFERAFYGIRKLLM